MKVLSTIIRSINQSRNWQSKLENIVGNDPNGDEIIELNRKKKSLGISGLGTVLFGELFNLETDSEVAYVTSAFNLFSSYIDCHLDGTHGFSLGETDQTDVGALLNETANYLECGNTKNELLLRGKHLVDYIRNSIISRDRPAMNQFCAYAIQYAESVENDFSLDIPHMRMEERIKLGEVYGSIISHLLDIFSKRKLTDRQRKAIQIYSACGALQDDFVDIWEDGNRSYILQRGGTFASTLSKLYNHRMKIFELYRQGSSLIENPNQRDDYEKMFNENTKTVTVTYIKEGSVYQLQCLKSIDPEHENLKTYIAISTPEKTNPVEGLELVYQFHSEEALARLPLTLLQYPSGYNQPWPDQLQDLKWNLLHQ